MSLRITTVLLVLTLLLDAGAVSAQQPPPGNDPISAALIPPDLIMAHQKDLGITDAQRAAIQSDMQRAQSQFTPLQWRLSAVVEKLAGLLKQPYVDESAALAQLDREQEIEHAIKRTQLSLMIRIKNELSAEQQRKALELKSRDHA